MPLPPDFSHYNIYRSDNEIGPFVLIGTSPTATFIDPTATVGNTYCYYVTTVDIYNNESDPSGVSCVFFSSVSAPIEGGIIAPENVLVVYRDGDADSQEFAELYRDLHNLDLDQLLAIPCSNQEVLANYATFQTQVETPIIAAMTSDPLVNRTIYAIVLCPFVCGGFMDGSDIISSTSRLSRIDFPYVKYERNPIFNRQTFKRYDSQDRAIALICTRFDAPTIEIAKTWLTNTRQAVGQRNVSGIFYLDPYSAYQGTEANIYTSDILLFNDALLPQLGLTVSSSTQVDPYIDPLIGSVEEDSFTWMWGADRGSLSYFRATTNLRAFFYNADFDGAETMRDIDANTWPLLAIRQGYVATAGSMSNPGYEAFLRPLPFFDALFRGAVLAEAFLFSQPYFNSPVAVFGDPLLSFVFPNQRSTITYEDPDRAWQEMADCLAQAVAYMYRKSNILAAVSSHIMAGDSPRVSDDLAYPFLDVKKIYNDKFWKNTFINVTKSLVNFGITRNLTAYPSFYPTLDEYLTRTGNKITELVLDVLQNEELKSSISSSNIREEGSWDFSFDLEHQPGTFAFYHIEIDVASDADFEDIIFSKRSLDDLTGWSYQNFSDDFVDFPYNGITSNYAGRTIRYSSQEVEILTRGEFYHYRVRQRDQDDNFTDYRYYRRIVYT